MVMMMMMMMMMITIIIMIMIMIIPKNLIYIVQFDTNGILTPLCIATT